MSEIEYERAIQKIRRRHCHHKWITYPKVKVCTRCGKEVERFIKPPENNFLFLSVEAKDEETKKFLEDVMKEKKRNVFKDIKEDGTIFIKERLEDGSVKILEVTNIFKECTRMAREIQERGA